MRIYSYAFLFVVYIFASIVLFANLRNQSIDKLSDEIIHLRVTQEIFHSKDYLNPTFSGDIYYNKPPLKMWLSQIPLNLLGESNLSYRLIDSICGLAFISIILLLSYKLFQSLTPGLLACLILLSSKELIWGAHGFRKGTQDDLLLTLVTLSYVYLWEIVKNERYNLKSSRFFILCIGLACLTKSIAGLIPLFTLASFLLTSNLKIKEKIEYLFQTFFLSLLIPAFYYIYHCLKSEVAWKKFFYIELIERATKGLHNQNDSYFYLREIFIKHSLTFPILTISALIFAMSKIHKLRDMRAIFLLLLSILPIIVYSIPNSRLPWYIFPSYPSLALLIGWMIYEFFLILINTHRLPIKVLTLIILTHFSSLYYVRLLNLKSSYSAINNRKRLEIDILSEHVLNNPTLNIYAFPEIVNYTPLVKRRNIDREAFYWTMIKNRLSQELNFEKGLVVVKRKNLKDLEVGYNTTILFELPRSRVRREETLVIEVEKIN